MYLNNDILGYERGGIGILRQSSKPKFCERSCNRPNDSQIYHINENSSDQNKNLPPNIILTNFSPKEKSFLESQSNISKNSNHFIFKSYNDKNKHQELLNYNNVRRPNLSKFSNIQLYSNGNSRVNENSRDSIANSSRSKCDKRMDDSRERCSNLRNKKPTIDKMEIFDEMIKNLAFCRKNKRSLQMNALDSSLSNKSYNRDSSSKRSISLPTKEFRNNLNNECKMNKKNSNAKFGINTLNSPRKSINPKYSKFDINSKMMIQGGRFLDHQNIKEPNQNHINRHQNFVDQKRNSLDFNSKFKSKPSFCIKRSEFSDLNDFINKNCNFHVKRLYKNDSRQRFKSKRALKYKLLESLNKEDKESVGRSSYSETENNG